MILKLVKYSSYLGIIIIFLKWFKLKKKIVNIISNIIYRVPLLPCTTENPRYFQKEKKLDFFGSLHTAVKPGVECLDDHHIPE